MEKPPQDAFLASGRGIGLESRIQVLLEEYRVLYGVLTFRLDALDRRHPVAGGTLAAILAATTAMPDDTKLAFLWGLPLALYWLVATTVGHACSKEDNLRRVDEIERQVNQLAGEELLVFQSRHPSKRQAAGRLGTATVLAVASVAIALLGACVFILERDGLLSAGADAGYFTYAGACAIGVLVTVSRLRSYVYRRSCSTPSPPFVARGTNIRQVLND